MASKKGKSQSAKRGFAFDLQKPLFKGNLLKQGEFHRAFRERFFVLYPGFLVYYDDIKTWQYDLQRGETLGGRLNAIKLKNGSVEKAKSHPRGAKHAFTLHAPDGSNKRHNILFNAKSNEERYQWMVKLGQAITGKDGGVSSQTKDNLKKPVEEVQNTALEEPSTGGDDKSPTTKESIEEKEVTTDTKPSEDTLKDIESELSLSKDADEFDGELGPRDNPTSVSSMGSAVELTDSSPEPSPSSKSPEEKKDVLTSVVSSASIKVQDDRRQSTDSIDKGPPPLLKRESTHRVIETSETVVHQPVGPKLSITITNGDDFEQLQQNLSDYDSDEDSDGVELPVTPLPTKKEMLPQASQESEEENESKPSLKPSSKPSSPKTSPTPDHSNNTVEKDSESTSRSQPTPQISIDVVSDERQPDSSGKSSPVLGVIKKDEFNPASPTPDRRRPSGVAGFIEKRGYLYKQGGKHKSWHLRYFVLQPGMFTYFKNDPKGKVLGEVKLSKRVKIYLPKPGEKKYSSYQFTIYSPSDWNKRSTYTISANNSSEMKDWIEAFKLASGLLRENSISSS